MKKIKKVGRLDPRIKIEFYQEHPDLFDKLKSGLTIEVPDELVPQLIGVEVTDETITRETITEVVPKEENVEEETKETEEAPVQLKKKKTKTRVYPQSQFDVEGKVL